MDPDAMFSALKGNLIRQRLVEYAAKARDAIWMMDEHAQCIYLNPAWSEWTGQPVALGLGTGWLAMVHPDDRDAAGAAYMAASLARLPYRAQFRLRLWNRDYVPIIDSGHPYFGTGGEFLGYFGAAITPDDARRRTSSLDDITDTDRDLLRAIVRGVSGPGAS